MNKRECLQKHWIPYSKRLPPNTPGLYIVLWNYDRKRPVVELSLIARAKAEELREDPKIMKKWEQEAKTETDRIAITGYKVSHWMFLPSPMVEKGVENV